MVPTFDKFMYPVLKLLNDGKVRTNREIQEAMITICSLTEEDLNDKTDKGGDRFKGNENWALRYLIC